MTVSNTSATRVRRRHRPPSAPTQLEVYPLFSEVPPVWESADGVEIIETRYVGQHRRDKNPRPTSGRQLMASGLLCATAAAAFTLGRAQTGIGVHTTPSRPATVAATPDGPAVGPGPAGSGGTDANDEQSARVCAHRSDLCGESVTAVRSAPPYLVFCGNNSDLCDTETTASGPATSQSLGPLGRHDG